MDIYYLGHSSFQIVGKNATVVTDPFDEKMVGLKYPKINADIVTVSHQHGDHNNVDLIENPDRVISGPGEYEIKKVSIFGIPSYHDDKKGAERGKNTIYVIETDNVRIVHLGDLGHKLSEADVDSMGEVDVLMVPIGGDYTIGPKDAADTVRSIEPKVVLPMHYQTSGLNQETFSALEGLEPFVSELGFKKEEQKKLSISESSLNTEEQVIVLLEKK